MKFATNLLICLLLSIKFSYAETTKVDPVKKLGSTLKAITGKSLNKEETKQFLSDFVLILEDERDDGTVTYLFDDRNYTRYKDYEEISTGDWRFTKTGVLRIFNKDIKLSWRIKLGKNNDNNINIKAKFDPIGKLYSFNYQEKDEFLSELNDYRDQLATEKKRKEQEKIDAQKKAEAEKAKLEQEKLEAQKKAEEEKARAEEEKAKLEQEKLEAQKKADEEKAKLEQEKAALEKEIAEQKKQLELEKLYIQLEPEYRNKCIKKALNDLFEVGTPEYKTCILNKGPDEQLKIAKEKKQKAEEEKSKLEQEKKEAQKKAKEDKAKKAKEEKAKKEKEKKLAANQKAKEEEERKKQAEKQKFSTSGRLKCHMTFMANLKTDVVKDVSNIRPRSYFYFNYDKANLKIDWTNTDGSRVNEEHYIKNFKEIWKEQYNGYTLIYDFIGNSSNKLHGEMLLTIETWRPTKGLAVATTKIPDVNFIYDCNKL